MVIVYHMSVLVSFVHKNHQSFVAVIENEAVGTPVLEMREGMGELWQDVVLCWRGCFGKVIQQQTGVCVQ